MVEVNHWPAPADPHKALTGVIQIIKEYTFNK
jgi:hypothetical protein